MLAACTVPQPPSAPEPTAELAGRTPGKPRRCIPIIQAEGLRIDDGNRLLYGHGRTVWVNSFSESCTGLRQGDTLVVESIGSRYCRGDIVRTTGPVSRIPGPACILGDFVPYTR